MFTTHVVFITDQLSQLMDSNSNRKFVYRALPLIPSLAAAQDAFDFGKLNAHEAIFCGGIPGLILMMKIQTFPTQKRKTAVDTFLATDYRDDTVLDLLESLITGNERSVPKSLSQLMDTSDGGKMRWIPDHMVYVLDEISKYGTRKLSNDLLVHLSTIVDLFRKFKGARTYGGDGWEALFGLVLLVRILTKQSDDLIDLASFPSPDTEFTTSFNSPLTMTPKQQFAEIKDVDVLMAAIPKKQDGARVAIYYPSHAGFKEYDMLVVMWNEAGDLFKTIGYQLKEGKEIPSDQARSDFQNFVVRGKAAQKPDKKRSWEVPSDAQSVCFFGCSGAQWTPKKWRELKGST